MKFLLENQQILLPALILSPLTASAEAEEEAGKIQNLTDMLKGI